MAEEEMLKRNFYHLDDNEELIEINYAAPRKKRGGHTGSSFLDSGYFYAPYVPLSSTPVVLPTMPVYQEDSANEFVDLSQVRTSNSRYKEYERLRNMTDEFGW